MNKPSHITGDLFLDNNTMCVFMDESGLSTLSGHNAFGIAGCIIHSSEISYIENKWKILIGTVFGNPNHKFHASADETKNLSKEHKQQIFNFFKENIFGRFAVGYHKNSQISDYSSDPYKICPELLKQRGFISLLEKYPLPQSHLSVLHPTKQLFLPSSLLPFRRIVFIFEDCERDREKIWESFSGLKYYINNIEINTELYFMPKGKAHACLQIADAIANVGFREVLRYCNGGEQGYDFKEIFHSIDKRYIYFMAIGSATKNAN